MYRFEVAHEVVNQSLPGLTKPLEIRFVFQSIEDPSVEVLIDIRSTAVIPYIVVLVEVVMAQ